MINLFFIIYNFLILSLNFLFILFFLYGFATHDDIAYSSNPEKTIFIKNTMFLVIYIFLYSLKIIILPLLSKIFKKNSYLRYLKYKLKTEKNFWVKLLLAAFLFDYLILLSFTLFVPDKNLLFLVFSPFVLMPFFYYLGGGVFLSYLGFVLWCNWLPPKTT